MKIAKLLGACLVVILTSGSCKKEDNNINNLLNEADSNFIRLASIGNVSEIETAKIAVSKTADSVVLSFAQQMLMEHTNAQNDLKTMGGVVGFTVKDTTYAANATITQLASLTGRAFDSTYIHTQLPEHQAAISFYTEELNNGNQMNVRAYANTILQNIRVHYQRADSIATAFY